jgi:hypothetical protein
LEPVNWLTVSHSVRVTSPISTGKAELRDVHFDRHGADPQLADEGVVPA